MLRLSVVVVVAIAAAAAAATARVRSGPLSVRLHVLPFKPKYAHKWVHIHARTAFPALTVHGARTDCLRRFKARRDKGKSVENS